jgi:hypothetical protein
MKLIEIHEELVHAFGEESYTLASVKHWIHELKTSRAILTDDLRPGRPSIDHIDAFILKQLSESPLASVRSLSEDLRIPKTTIWRGLTESLQLKSRHFKWVPSMLTKELRQKRVDGARALLDTLEV